MNRTLWAAFFISIMLIIMSHCARAAGWAPTDPRWITPPHRFDHPFRGYTTVQQRWAGTEWLSCDGLVYGCAFVKSYWLPQARRWVPLCEIHVWAKKYNNSLYRHERAHCNGWPANHPR